MVGAVGQIQNRSLQRLYAYWNNVRGSRELPAWRDFDAHHLSFIVNNMLLIEASYQPLRFRFRLHGLELAWRIGYDMTGKLVDDLPHPQNRAVLLDRCRWLISNRCPRVARSERVVAGREIPYEVVWLPLSDDGQTIDLLLGALEYLDRAPTGRVL
jgi:hypothetical protein